MSGVVQDQLRIGNATAASALPPSSGKRPRSTEVIVEVSTNQVDVGESRDFICIAEEDYTLLEVAGAR